MPITIGIIAGEASGDILGAHLISALHQQHPSLKFVGIAGPKMQALGAKTLAPMEQLSVCGIFEVLRHLWGLWRLRRRLLAYFIAHRPALFIGIDAPDFNLGLERQLKKIGIPVIHYVSPSLWAWRKGRLTAIAEAVNHVLTLFPFEPALYKAANIPATFVGHSLADTLPLYPRPKLARKQLQLPAHVPLIALLAGSRNNEIERHAMLLVDTARQIQKRLPDAIFVLPMVNVASHELFVRLTAHSQPPLPLHFVVQQTQLALTAADVVLVASGTATLEAALLKKPMVIFYRVSALTWFIVKLMCRTRWVGLPNILAGRTVVPELLQHEATPERLADEALLLLADASQRADLKRCFTSLHHNLKQNAAQRAAQVVLGYLGTSL